MQVALRSAVLRPQQRASAPGRRATACSVARHQPHSARRAAAPLSPLAPRRSLACRAATLDAAATAAPPSSVNWREQWYAVAFLSDLDPVAPVPFQLLGENIVLWRDGEGEWRAFADRCPHRQAPLSEGRVNEAGDLECPYHGWAFAGADGACTVIPQDGPAGSAKASPRACATPYATAVAQGMLFVRPGGTGPASPLPLVAELEDPGFICIDIARDLPYDYATLLENVLDVAHVPWVHHLTVSNRANAAPVELEVPSPVNAAGFDGMWTEGPRRGALGPQSTRFIAPSLMVHSLSAKSLGTTLTVVYATPSAPGRVRLLARFPFKFNAALPRLVISKAPRWLQHLGQNGVLEDDQIMLHVQERAVQADLAAGKTYAQACYMPLASDAYVIAFRTWLQRFAGGAPAWPKGMAAALPPVAEVKEALLDRYNSHTKNCTSCMKALAGVRAARAAAVAVGAIAALVVSGTLAAAALLAGGATALPLKAAAIAAAVVVAALAAWARLGGLEQQFMQGPYPPPRNRKTGKKLISRGPKNSGQNIKLV